MTHTRRYIIMSSLAALVAGCNSSEPPPGGGSDGTVNPSSDKGGKSGCGGLCVSALGLSLVLEPFADEGKGLVGQICVKDSLGQHTIKDATVTVNGATVPHDAFLTDCWQPSSVAIPDVGPGKKITITATQGTDSGSIEFTCPAEVKITVPAEGAKVTVGQKITASWDGKIDYDPVLKSWAAIDHYDAATGKGKLASAVASDSHVTLKGTETSVSLMVPTAEYSGFAVELGVMGQGTMVRGSIEGYCALVRRVHVVP